MVWVYPGRERDPRTLGVVIAVVDVVAASIDVRVVGVVDASVVYVCLCVVSACVCVCACECIMCLSV